MTIQEVCKAIAETGDFPLVKFTGQPHKNFENYYPNSFGRVTQIRPFGISVDLGSKLGDRWFHATDGDDKRKTYMKDLEFI